MKYANVPELEIQPGDQVRFRRDDESKKIHETLPAFNPEPGTVGTVVDAVRENDVLVQWPDGATREHGKWWTFAEYLDFVSREDAQA